MRYLVGHANYGRVEPGTGQNPAGRRFNRTKQMLQGFAMQCFKVSLWIFWGLSVLTQPHLNCLTALLLCFDPSEVALWSCRGALPPPGSASEVGAMRAGSKTGEAQGCKKCSSRTERLGSSLPAITRWFISPTGLISFRPLDIAWIILDQGDTIATYCNAFFPHRADLHIRPVFQKHRQSVHCSNHCQQGQGQQDREPARSTVRARANYPAQKTATAARQTNAGGWSAQFERHKTNCVSKTFCGSPNRQDMQYPITRSHGIVQLYPTLKLLKTSHLHP
jgi:hypothetical protein